MSSIFDEPETTTETQESLKRKALDFANNYVALFVHNPTGRLLLDHWTETVMNKQTPVNAPHTEYAFNEAQRAFIRGIHSQIKLAQDSTMR